MWNDPKRVMPVQGESVLLKLKDGSVHEGHYLKHANKYERNVNKWRIYKTGKCVDFDDVILWSDMPKVITVINRGRSDY